MKVNEQQLLVVVVLYNPSHDVVGRYKRYFGKCKLIFIDNSEQATVVKNNESVIRFHKNKGYAAAANKALTLMKETDEVRWVLVLNQDLTFTRFQVSLLLQQLRNSNCDIGGPFVGYLDNLKWTTFVSRTPDFDLKRIKYVSGSFLAINRNVLNKQLYFYEPFFMYYEDVDFCVRAYNSGLVLGYIPVHGVSHCEESSSFGKGSNLHEYYLARNHLLFVERQAPLYVKLCVFAGIIKSLFYNRFRSKS
ncbi:MAG: glycosyltransferase family 2 protein, partial [Bacteroidetes bacterium]